MKTKIIILAVLVSMLTFTVATTQSVKQQPKVVLKKSVPVATRMDKGFAMEDKDQFN